MQIIISETNIDPWQILSEYSAPAGYGATAIFIGTMRDFNQGDDVTAMFLEHYPSMTEKQLRSIVNKAAEQWALEDCLVVHRVGEVKPQDTLVIVAVWSKHRGDAFDASRFIMETLKHQAPFWKRETLVSGEVRWVSRNSDGYLNSKD